MRTTRDHFNALGVLADVSEWKWKGPDDKLGRYYLESMKDPLLGVPESFRIDVGLDRETLGEAIEMIQRGRKPGEIAAHIDAKFAVSTTRLIETIEWGRAKMKELSTDTTKPNA